MVNQSLIRDLDVDDAELEAEIAAAFAGINEDEIAGQIAKQGYEVNKIVSGKITRIIGDDVVIDIGFKSEGVVSKREWDDEPPPQIGDEVKVLLEGIEETGNVIMLSKRKARRIIEWERIIKERKEGDIVRGIATRKIKGGLLVDIGVNVFLPASQVDIRRPNEISEYLDKEIECVILKIDEPRRNIVVSRRKLLENEREEMRNKLLGSLEVGQRRKGVVKNIAEFGAFVDLGGIDGLLHITDMSWGRIGHPSEVVKIDQEIEVVVLNFDRDKGKIALGLKQKDPSPWDKVQDRFKVGEIVKGEVVNVMGYGAFVKLDEGIEGLVHISEMSWTKRINHPSEVVAVGDVIDVVVLGVKPEQHEISLGIKQTQPNPWDEVARKYPPGTHVTGKVRNLTNYGAFIEIEEGIDGLLHVSDISWVRKVGHPSEVLKKDEELECQVLSVDQERKRIALGMKQLRPDPWLEEIPTKYQPGSTCSGKVTKLTNFGVFVELEPGLEGLLHISELSDNKVNGPEDIVKVGDTIECKVIRVDAEDRKIGLSRRAVGKDMTPEELKKAGEDLAAREKSVPRDTKELKGGGAGGSTGPLFGGGGGGKKKS